VDVDRGELVRRRLEDVAIVMKLHEFAPVGGRPASGRDRRRFERFAKMREDFPDRAGLRDERDQPDVAAARRARKRKLLPHPRHQLGPCNPGCVVGAGLFICIAAAFRGMSAGRMPAGRGISPLADVADGERRDGRAQRVVRRKHPVIPLPMPSRLRDEIRKPVEKLKGRELDDAVGSRLRGFSLPAGPDPVGGLVPGHHVADAGDAAVGVADHGEPLECEGGPGTVPQQMLVPMIFRKWDGLF